MRKSIPPVLAAVTIAATALGATLSLPTASTTAAPVQSTASQQTSAQATPAPHILNFAQGLQNSPKKLPSSAVPVPQSPGFDGCDHNYGNGGQCVPWVFPPGVGDSKQARCGWLDAHGLKGVKVNGHDRLNLDPNRSGVACGPGP